MKAKAFFKGAFFLVLLLGLGFGALVGGVYMMDKSNRDAFVEQYQKLKESPGYMRRVPMENWQGRVEEISEGDNTQIIFIKYVPEGTVNADDESIEFEVQYVSQKLPEGVQKGAYVIVASGVVYAYEPDVVLEVREGDIGVRKRFVFFD